MSDELEKNEGEGERTKKSRKVKREERRKGELCAGKDQIQMRNSFTKLRMR